MNASALVPLMVGIVFAFSVVGVGTLMLGHRHKHSRRRKRSSSSRRPPPPPPPAPAVAKEAEPRDNKPYDPFECGSPEDKRKALRRPGKPVVVLVSDADAKAEPFRATVVDRSVTGLRLATDRPFDPGTVLSVRVSHAPNMIPWVRVQVRNQASTDEGWHIGCQFAESVPSSVLWLFG